MYRYTHILLPKVLKYLSVIAALIISAVILSFWIGGDYRGDLDKTLAVCKNAMTDRTLNKQCGQLQDQTRTEYICGKYQCWLEVK